MRIRVTPLRFSSSRNRYMITPNISVTHISLAASCTLYILYSFLLHRTGESIRRKP